MAVSLQKGQKISLTKGNAGLSQVVVGLGWDEVQQSRGLFSRKAQAIDCDASALLLKNGHLSGKGDIIYYGNLRHTSNSVVHCGDNLTGAGQGDDEQIVVDLSRVPYDIDRIVFVVNIYKAYDRNQHFGMINNAFIRIVDSRNNTEMCRYSLTDDYSSQTALIFGEIYKHGEEWKFNAIGQGTTDASLSDLARKFS